MKKTGPWAKYDVIYVKFISITMY